MMYSPMNSFLCSESSVTYFLADTPTHKGDGLLFFWLRLVTEGGGGVLIVLSQARSPIVVNARK
jgi:hypothetical protein